MGKLTAAAVRAAKCPSNSRRPVRFGDRDGLYLQVAPGDTKSWLFRYTLRGKAREMGLGPVGEPPVGVPLAKARALAAEVRALLREGRDPIDDRRGARQREQNVKAEAKERTFEAAALALVESKRSGWRNAKHGAQWLATLEAHAFPTLGDMPVAAVGTNEVLQVLRPIWERVPETASRVRQRIEAVLDAASVKGWRTGENPARWKGHLAGELPPPRKVGNTSLIIEAEMFGQPTLRAKWKKEHGVRPEDIQGLAVEEHVARLRDKLLPLARQFHQMATEAIEALRKHRDAPALHLERVAPLNLVVVPPVAHCKHAS